jgi:hypothetical protein
VTRAKRRQFKLDDLDEFEREMDKYAGLGVDINPRDPNPISQPWYRALMHLDRGGDKTALLRLLNSDAPLTRQVRRHLADLLARYDLRQPRGRPRIPSYDPVSGATTKLMLAVEDLREAEREGWLHDDALQQVADAHGLTEQTIERALAGKRSDVRRARAKK